MIQVANTPRKTTTRNAKRYRFDARLNEAQKTLIQRAADLEGRSVTDFVMQSAERAAEQTIQSRALLVLSVEATDAFVQAILRPAAPGRVLGKAAREYRRLSGR